MRALVGILIVIVLFWYCFIFTAEKQLRDDILFLPEKNFYIPPKTDEKQGVKPAGGAGRAKISTPARAKKAKKRTYPAFIKQDKITLFVNNPFEFDFPSSKSRMAPCRFLLNEIQNAKNSIDFAIYGFDKQPEFTQALINASKRGVEIRGISNSKAGDIPEYPEIENLKTAAKIVYDNSRYLMHNKFFIIDDKLVFTGTMNISSTGCGGYNSNNVAAVEIPEIVLAYKNEFNQMFSGKFKKQKENFSTPPLNPVSVHFSPGDETFDNVILPLIKSAKNQIRISVFVFTHKQFAKELINAANKGIDVRAIVDATGALRNRELIEFLRQNNIKLKVENWGGKNHEKTFSIDDNILVTGSANFSYSGFLNNDENILIIKNKKLASFYNGFFDMLYFSIDDKYLAAFPSAESPESGKSCYDGIDNDYDGKIDKDDSGCKIQ